MSLRDGIDAIDLIVPKLGSADHILITDSRELVGTSRDGPWRGFRETPGRRYERGRSGTSRDWLELTGSQGVRGSNPLSSTRKCSGTNGFWLFLEDHDGCRNRRLITFGHIRRGHDACRQRHQVGRSPVCPRFRTAVCADTALGEGCAFARPAAPGHAAKSSGRLVRSGSNSSFRVDPLPPVQRTPM